jgi:hypothetical protein
MALEESCRSANNAVLVALMNTGDGREALLALFGGVFEQTCPGGAGLDLGDLGPGMGRVRADVVYENPDMAGAAHALGCAGAGAKHPLLQSSQSRDSASTVDTTVWQKVFVETANRFREVDDLLVTTDDRALIGQEGKGVMVDPMCIDQGAFHRMYLVKVCMWGSH